jgi:hypothetical protein
MQTFARYLWVLVSATIMAGTLLTARAGETPTPAPTDTPSGRPSPTPPATLTISGTIGQCSTAGSSGILLPNVTVQLTGTISATTTTDDSGNYSFTDLPYDGVYTVTPSKARRPPGSPGIDTLDVQKAQALHFAEPPPVLLCDSIAADCAPPVGITTADIIAIQRFFLALSTGIGNVGKYQFSPVSRSYSPLVTDQTEQDFDTVVLGDATLPYAFP